MKLFLGAVMRSIKHDGMERRSRPLSGSESAREGCNKPGDHAHPHSSYEMRYASSLVELQFLFSSLLIFMHMYPKPFSMFSPFLLRSRSDTTRIGYELCALSRLPPRHARPVAIKTSPFSPP
jgi:hypothetical protein